MGQTEAMQPDGCKNPPVRTPRQMWQQFRSDWRHFVAQSLLATTVIFIVFVILGSQEIAVVASLGATAFIVFALPDKFTARPRHVIGGHLVGVLCGLLGATIAGLLSPDSAGVIWCDVVHGAGYAVAVGLAIFVMVVIDVEHPPAAGTALGVAVEGFSWQVAATVLGVAVFLSAVRFAFRRHLHDLT